MPTKSTKMSSSSAGTTARRRRAHASSRTWTSSNYIERFLRGIARWVGVLDVRLGDRTEQNNRTQEERKTSMAMRLAEQLPRKLVRAGQVHRASLVRGTAYVSTTTSNLHLSTRPSHLPLFHITLTPRGLRAPEKTTHVNYSANRITIKSREMIKDPFQLPIFP